MPPNGWKKTAKAGQGEQAAALLAGLEAALGEFEHWLQQQDTASV
ncbi:hypothetical protein [Aquitalea magnusonii]|nr:hypothetical protein [Aquitalea magnusonii]